MALSRKQYQRQAQAKWVDRCRVVADTQGLQAVPYLEATRCADYELGATLAAIAANRFIRTLIQSSKLDETKRHPTQP